MGRLTHTVSGSIATVRSPAVAPIESLKVHFSPIQEGTGDPSPSNVRPITGWTGVTGYKSGKNLAHCIGWSAWSLNSVLDNRAIANTYGTTLNTTDFVGQDGAVVITQTDHPSSEDSSIERQSYRNGYVCIVPDNLKFGRIYNISFKVTDIISNPLNVSISDFKLYSPSGSQYSTTLVNDNKICFNNFIYSQNSSRPECVTIDIRICGMSCTISEFMVCDATDFNYDYEPYSGETIPVTFPAGGKNILNPDTFTKGTVIPADGAITSYEGSMVSDFVPVKNIAYTFSGKNNTPNYSKTTRIHAFDKNKSWLRQLDNQARNTNADYLMTFIPQEDVSYIRISTTSDLLNGQLEIGSTVSAFEPYTDTMYGGYVDLATGDIIAEWKIFDLSAIQFEASKDTALSQIDRFVATLSINDYGGGVYTTPPDVYNDRFKPENIVYANDNQTPWVVCALTGSGSKKLYFYTPKDTYVDVASFKQAMANSPIICKISTPQLIATLTPQELATFKGYSNFWSNAGDVDVTYQVVESSEMTKERQKIFAGNAPSIHTASGSVANFNMEPGLNRNLKSCKVGFLPVQEGTGDPFPPINQNGSIVGVDNLHNESELSSFKIHFSPIQEGSGDPSPTNIRPITGWTGVTGYKGGKNLFDITIVINGKTLDGYGNVVTNSSRSVTDFIILKPGTYTISRSLATDYWKMYQYDMNENPVNLILDSAVLYKVFTITELSKIRIAFDYFPTSADEIQLEVGSIATTYEAYSAPTSYPVSWESQGAIYGGYVDLVSGDVVKTYEIVDDLSTLYWRDNGPINNYNIHEYLSTDLVDVIAKTSSSDDQYCIACSKYKAIDRTTQYSNRIINTIASTTGGQIRIYSEGVSTYSTVQEFKESLSGVSLVYQLATPVIVTTLTPTQMALATGKSSYWSNADSVTVGTAGNVRPIKGWGKINAYSSDENLASNISNWSNMQNDNGCWKNTNVDTKQYFHCVVQLFNNSTYIKTVSEKAIKTIGANSMKFSIDVDNCTRIVLKHSGSTRDLSLSIPSNSIFSQGNYTIGFNVVSINSNVIGGLKISDIIMCPTANYNICSITFPIQSKNLCPPLIKGKGVYVNTGTEFSADNIAVSDYIPVNFADNQNYYLSGLLYSYHSFVAAYNINKQYLGRCGGAQRSNLSITDSIFTVDTTQETGDIAFLRVEQYNITNMADINDAKIQLEVGSSATSYEPYNNSIFGGYVDLVTGEVIAEYIKMVCDGSEDEPWNVSLHYGSSDLTRVYINSAYAKSSGNAFFNYCKKSGAQKVWNAWISSTNSNVLMYVPSEINSKASWLEYLSKNPLEIVYELATPQLVTTLTPTQIQALKGTNNILSDANGIIEVKYWSH